ncbi:helix-turn-helix domain-containing protein [Aestuariivivens insulae]|uniref:helix-turn-helix domain-containing protein n=1 Tax=Aestuariivivens insulae TaxID=1621988 RepID=UPI001F58AE2D|nr:helix-turn-helix transcriptional regulator [Aestuariivivens insulae]
MVNSEAFTKRLQEIMDYHGESASSFAEKIGVQRSSISHILSGRNKPSLEFVLKIVSAYPDVELYWLLNGKGSFPSFGDKKESVQDLIPETKNMSSEPKKEIQSQKSIERIVIFYSDGTFKSFQN